MRLARLSLGALTLLLLIAVPVNAAPDLHAGSQTSYNLSVSVSLLQSCAPILSSTLSAGIVCPMIAMISPSLNINGTLGWIVTDLKSTTATSWGSTMPGLDVTMMRQPFHTMWWVNGPLKVNDTVPVLVFPTNVTGSTSLDLGGGIGTRSAWTLLFPRTGSPLPPDPMTTMASTIPITNNFGFALTFNYDQTSDLLLSASADIHLGFGEETFIPQAPCDYSANTAPA